MHLGDPLPLLLTLLLFLAVPPVDEGGVLQVLASRLREPSVGDGPRQSRGSESDRTGRNGSSAAARATGSGAAPPSQPVGRPLLAQDARDGLVELERLRLRHFRAGDQGAGSGYRQARSARGWVYVHRH